MTALPRTPWIVVPNKHPSFGPDVLIKDADGDGIADCSDVANAEHIVRCVNAHEGLLAFVDEIVPFLHNVEHVERARELLARAKEAHGR